MASLKRSRASLRESGESSDDDEEALTGRSSQHAKKRPRDSNSVATGTDTDASEDSSSQHTDASLPDNDIDEDELELRATQLIQEKYSFLSDESNIPAEHGILERVECYNFMCHNHFCVELGPLINFIVGKNGSGKSAILTAITLCLGGKASATNRGQSLKSFVKEGKDNATIIVRIKNRGDGAYLPDDYGNSIIVERHFSKTGTSGFKIKGEHGRIVSTKKAELDAITDFFSLQIDNPMNVLSQDQARQFLSSSSPADKYRFFVKGVQLEQLDQDYRLLADYIDQIEEKLLMRADDIKVLENRKDQANRKLEISEQHDSLRGRIRKLRSQMAWVQVEEQEKIRDGLQDELDKAEADIAAAEAALTRFDAAFLEVEGEAETAKSAVAQMTASLDQLRGERADIQAKVDETTTERHDLQAQQRQIHEYLKAAESRIKETEEKIEEENQRLADVHGGSFARKQAELEQKKEELKDAEQQYSDHVKLRDQLMKERDAAEQDVKSAEPPIQSKKGNIEQAELRLKNLTREDGQRKSGYHDKLPSLQRAIQNETSFQRRPVGPIGNYITLLKPKWSSVLENSFGTTLNSFIVTSKRDMNLLSQIMERVKCVCPIFIGSEGWIDTLAHEPDAQYDTALRVLQIDDDLVRRQLIINHGIEQVLLIDKLEEASAIMFDGPRPRNVKRCFCIDRQNRQRGIHLSYGRSGEPSQTPVAAYTGNPRMKSDLAAQIAIQREAVNDLKREKTELEREVRAAQARLESCKQAVVRHDRRAKDLQVTVQRLEDQIEELNGILERETVEDGRLDVLQATLREVQEEKELNQGSYDDSKTAIDDVTTRLKLVRRELSQKDTDIREAERQLQVAQSEEARVAEKRAKVLSDKNEAIERIDDMKLDKARISERKDQLAARVLDYSEKASLVSPRVPIEPGETGASLDKKLDKLNRDLQRYDQQLGATREQIVAEAVAASAAYERARRQIADYEKLARCFKNALKGRKERWKRFRSSITTRARAQFTYLLSERSFRGRLLADHDNRLLDLQVEPDITKDSTGRGAKTLSGGEKSFSQICLLLALWEAMGSPIRCLDEFDVYMDSVNRKMAIDMLMLAARRSIGRQFILITPGSRAEISLAPDVRVKELAEPERGQATLSFRR